MKLIAFFLLGLLFGFLCNYLPRNTPPTRTINTSPKTCEHSENSFRCVEYVSNYDGDTIKFNIPGVPALFGKEISVRLLGVDTAEKRGHLPCEKKAAQKAQQRVHDILVKAKHIQLTQVAKDKYFRILAEIEADDIKLSEVLLREKLAYAYQGKTKEKTNWCERLKLTHE